MSAILATSGAIRSLVDGTLRLTVDIEPSDAQAAFALFGRPGTSVALARITNEAAVAHDRAVADQKPGRISLGQDGEADGTAPAHAGPAPARPGASPSAPLPTRRFLPLASKVALTCRDPEFHEFLRTDPSGFAMEWSRPSLAGADAIGRAQALVKWWCDVERKRDIERNDKALARWRELDREFQQWRGSRELARRTGAAA